MLVISVLEAALLVLVRSSVHVHVLYACGCVRAGLSPDLQSMEQIRRIMRPTDVPDQGLLCDLLWSDPGTSPLAFRSSLHTSTLYTLSYCTVRRQLYNARTIIVHHEDDDAVDCLTRYGSRSLECELFALLR